MTRLSKSSIQVIDHTLVYNLAQKGSLVEHNSRRSRPVLFTETIREVLIFPIMTSKNKGHAILVSYSESECKTTP
jgi:hypothetical protein